MNWVVELFFGSKMSLNLGHFEPRVLWKWVARVVAWGVRVSAYFACTSHVLYMPTHLCPRVEGGSGVNRNIQRVHDASIYPSAKACLILTLVWYIYCLIHATNFSGAAPRNNVGGNFEATGRAPSSFYPYVSGNVLKWSTLLKFGVRDNSEVR